MTETEHPRPSAPARLNRRILLMVCGGLALLLLAVLVILTLGGSGLDGHAKKACASVKQVNEGTTIEERLGGELDAIREAQKSKVDGLHAAGSKKSIASQLPYDSPLYENPADIRYNAVAQWCRRNA